MDGLTFLSAVWRFRELNALLASTKSTAFSSLELNARFIAWTAAAVWPAQSWVEPAASWISSLVTVSTALATILRTVSQIPIGRTPGFLLRATKRQAKSGLSPSGSTKVVQIFLVRRANEWQISSEADLKEVHILLHPCASIPDAPLGRKRMDKVVDRSPYPRGWLGPLVGLRGV